MKAMAIFGWLVLVALCAGFALLAWIGTLTEFGRVSDPEVLITAGISVTCGTFAWLGRPTKWNKKDEVKK